MSAPQSNLHARQLSRCRTLPLVETAKLVHHVLAGLPAKCAVKLRLAGTLAVRAVSFALVLIRRLMASPFKQRRARMRWLMEASGLRSPINNVPGLSEPAKRVYRYVASVTLRFGFTYLRMKTISRGSGVSERRAREAIRELELRGLLTHQHRRTWHGRGAQSYRVKRI